MSFEVEGNRVSKFKVKTVIKELLKRNDDKKCKD